MGYIWNPSGSGSSASGTVTGGSNEGSGQNVFDSINSTASTLYFKSLTSADSSLLITNSSTEVDLVFNGSGGISWSEISGTSQTAAINTGYLANNAGLVTITLPANFAVGDVIRIAGVGAGGWKLAQGAGQRIHFGDLSSTSGVGGYLSSTHNRDSIELVGCATDTELMVISSIGNVTII